MLEGGKKNIMIKVPWLDGEQWRMFPAISGTLGPAWRTSTEILPLREIRKKICCCGQQSEGYVYSTVTGTTTAVAMLMKKPWFGCLTHCDREERILHCCCDNYDCVWAEWQERNNNNHFKIGHISVQSQSRRIGCGFHTFTEGFGDTDGVCHDWNVCQCQGSDHKPLGY